MVMTREPLDAVERAKRDEAPRQPLKQAGLQERARAVAIDLVLSIGVAWVAAVAVFSVVCAATRAPEGGEYANDVGSARVWLWAMLPVAYLLFGLIHEVYVLHRHGTTVGKSRLRLRVESATEAPLTYSRLLVRFLLGPKGPLAPVTVLQSLVCAQAVHDTAAGTRVVVAEPEAAVVVGKLAYLPGILSALAAAMIVLGLLLLTRFEALFVELNETSAPVARIAAEVRQWATVWTPPGVLAVVLVWLQPRGRFDVIAAWWISIVLLVLAVIGLLVLGPIGLMSILSLHMTLPG